MSETDPRALDDLAQRIAAECNLPVDDTREFVTRLRKQADLVNAIRQVFDLVGGNVANLRIHKDGSYETVAKTTKKKAKRSAPRQTQPGGSPGRPKLDISNLVAAYRSLVSSGVKPSPSAVLRVEGSTVSYGMVRNRWDEIVAAASTTATNA